MSIKVRFMANIWEIVGKDEVDLEVDADADPPPTAREVIMKVAEAENRDFSSLLRVGEGGSSWSAIRVVRNGRVLPSLDVEVADGDVLVLVPLLGAG
jgi:molybdopterin converting factor small subunit